MRTWGTSRPGGPEAEQSPARFGRRPERVDRERERERQRVLNRAALPDILRALSLLPTTTCVMTAAHETKRNGLLVSRVMKAADEPACVCVAVPAGQRLATLIRDSHAFALCAVDPNSRLMQKKFGPEETADPFDMLEIRTLVTGSPILARSTLALDCEVLRHLDLEADHEIYVGQVLSAIVDGTQVAPSVAMGGLAGLNGAGH